MQQTPQMIPMMPSFPQQTNITTEQIQKVCFFHCFNPYLSIWCKK